MMEASTNGYVSSTIQGAVAAAAAEMTCDRCGNRMVLRNGSRGEFYGCSGFPKCRNVKAV